MRPLTDTMPKPLVRVAGQPLLDHVLDKLAGAGVAEAGGQRALSARPDHQAHQIAQEAACDHFRRARPGARHGGAPCVKALPLLGDAPFFHVMPTRCGSTACGRIWRGLAEAFDPARMDILLVMAPTTSSIGYSGRGDYSMLPDGALRQAP
jgi:MurNAc alpha-1-phosphate uridylyltransferase